MSVLDVVLLSVLGTAILLIAVYFLVKAAKSAWVLLNGLVGTLNKILRSLYDVSTLLRIIQGEMSFMRSVTQAANPNFGQEVPQPPLGRAGTMPGSGGTPQFPTPVWDKFPTAEPAKPEDTDLRILEQDEQDMMEAQALEELRARGIEPDNDDEPRPAVGEEA